MMKGEVTDSNGNIVFSSEYVSGGGVGGYRDGLLHHTERKFLMDVENRLAFGEIEPGANLYMQGYLDPCKPGCQSAIRSYIKENGGTAIYYASSTGNMFYWERYNNAKLKGTVMQSITNSSGKTVSYRYWQSSIGRWKRAIIE